MIFPLRDCCFWRRKHRTLLYGWISRQRWTGGEGATQTVKFMISGSTRLNDCCKKPITQWLPQLYVPGRDRHQTLSMECTQMSADHGVLEHAVMSLNKLTQPTINSNLALLFKTKYIFLIVTLLNLGNSCALWCITPTREHHQQRTMMAI